MPVFHSPLALMLHQKAAFQRSERSARQQWRQIPEGAYRDFKELTSGGVSSRSLRAMGHPYARLGGRGGQFVGRGAKKGYGRGAAPLLPINKQSGKLWSSVTLWHRSSAYTLESSVGFDAAKAGKSIFAVAPRGTKYVVPRGVFPEIRRRGMARSRAFHDVFFRGQRQAFATP